MNEQSRNALFARVRRFSQSTPAWAQATRYQTQQDEIFHIHLVAERVYGNPDDWQVIQAAAGLDSPEYPLTERLLVLPTLGQLREMKRLAGFSDAEIY